MADKLRNNYHKTKNITFDGYNNMSYLLNHPKIKKIIDCTTEM